MQADCQTVIIIKAIIIILPTLTTPCVSLYDDNNLFVIIVFINGTVIATISNNIHHVECIYQPSWQFMILQLFYYHGIKLIK